MTLRQVRSSTRPSSPSLKFFTELIGWEHDLGSLFCQNLHSSLYHYLHGNLCFTGWTIQCIITLSLETTLSHDFYMSRQQCCCTLTPSSSCTSVPCEDSRGRAARGNRTCEKCILRFPVSDTHVVLVQVMGCHNTTELDTKVEKRTLRSFHLL
jgi:hypothetical protein